MCWEHYTRRSEEHLSLTWGDYAEKQGKSRDSKGLFMSRHPPGWSTAGGSSVRGLTGATWAEAWPAWQLSVAETSSVRGKLVMSWDKAAGPRVRSSLQVHV